MEIPQLNKEYNCFDDGKIRESRRYQVTVKEIIPFSDIDLDTLEQWKDEVRECDFLYKKETDYFIKTWNGSDIETFVRTKEDYWFSMGWLNCGKMDVDGSLNKLIL